MSKALIVSYVLFSSFACNLFLGQGAHAINPDFYRQKKAKERMRIERERKAFEVTKKRKKFNRSREKLAKSYSKERAKLIKVKEKRESFFDKDFAEKENFKNRKVSQAARAAKKRRAKSEVSWQDENTEYEIRTLKK